MNISIIIPTFNEERFISAAIQIIKKRAARKNETEIIVVDGGSDDHTVAEAQKQNVRIIQAPTARRSIQMNKGAEVAANEVLYFLHADTRPPSGFDRLINEKLTAGYHGGCFQLSFDSDQPLLRFYGWCTRFNIDAFRYGDQSLFITRKVFEALNGFRDDYILMEDHELVKRMKKSYSFCLCNQKVVTSARKYKRNGALRLQGVYGLIFVCYKLGVGQPGLDSIYRKLVR